MRRLAVSLPLGLALALAAAPSLAADQTVKACCALGSGQNVFDPKTVEIGVGETVTWQNDGGFHNVVFDDGSFDQPADPRPDAWTVSRKFDAAGEYLYYCEAHGNKGGVGMAGKVIVGGGAPPPPPGGDTTDPAISSLRVNPATFCNKKSKSCPKVGTRIRFTLSEDAKVQATILRRDTGDVVKVLNFSRKAGSNSVKFSGKGLARTRYRLEMTATDAAGNVSKPAKTSFKVAKKR